MSALHVAFMELVLAKNASCQLNRPSSHTMQCSTRVFNVKLVEGCQTTNVTFFALCWRNETIHIRIITYVSNAMLVIGCVVESP